MNFSIKSKMKEIKANEAAAAIVDKHIPDVWKHPEIGMVMGMSLKMIAAVPQAKISKKTLQEIDEELKQL